MLQVPILYDKQTKTIVSNESADIIRMFATECQVRLSLPHLDRLLSQTLDNLVNRAMTPTQLLIDLLHVHLALLACMLRFTAF